MAARFEISKADDGRYMFNLKAANGQVILTSQMYGARASAKGGIESVVRHAVVVDNFDRRVANDGSPYFVLVASNREEVGRSQMYSSKGAMENGIASVAMSAKAATIIDV